MIDWNVEQLRDALFAPARDDRPGLKEVRFNRCPFVAPIEVLRKQDADRLHLDVAAIQARFEELRHHVGLASKIAAIYDRQIEPTLRDPDAALYDGFISDDDKALCGLVLTQVLAGESTAHIVFSDGRLNELLFRMRARRDESGLTAAERGRWRDWLKKKLIDGAEGQFTLRRFRQAIAELDAPAEIVCALTDHADAIANELSDMAPT